MNYGWNYTRSALDRHLVNYLARDAYALMDGNLGAVDSLSGLSLSNISARNALAHAQVSSEWAWKYGRAVATQAGNEKEGGVSMGDINVGTPEGKDSYKDQYNNEVGRLITDWAKANGKTQAQIDDLLVDAFKNGHLIVELTDSRITNKDIPTWTAPSAGWETAANDRDYSNVDDFEEDPLGWLDDFSDKFGIIGGFPWVNLPEFMEDLLALYAFAKSVGSPLVLDLDDSGTIELKSLVNSSTYWDIDADGFSEHSGWVTGGDGLLAIDLNEDGIINDNTELFGNSSGFANGFSALSSYDDNNDQLIDANDAIFDELLIWIDSDENGYSEAIELYSLLDLDIISIALNAAEVSQTNQGHAITHTSTFTVNTGSGLDTRIVHDVWFEHENVNTIYTDDVELDPLTIFLPLLRGYGQLPDMAIAASLDPGLREMLSDFWLQGIDDIFTDDFTAIEDVKNILFKWADVEGVASNSRGPNVNGQELGFLDKLTGESFMQHGAYANPYFFAAQALNEAFNIALNNFAARLITQTIGDELFDGDWYYNIATDNFDGITGLNLTTLGNLETLAASQTSKDVFWQNIVRVIEGTIGIDNLSSGDEAALNSAIYDSDNTLSLSIIQSSMEWDNGTTTTWTGSTSGADAYTGGSGMDSISGGYGNDTLNGGLGADLLFGDSDNDILDGQGGDDYVRGGLGNDTYKYTAGHGWDTFEDFSTGTDKILFAAGVTISDLTISRASNNDLLIEIASGVGGGRILVRNQFNTTNQIETLEFSGGSTYTLTDKDYTLQGTDSSENLWGVSAGGDGEDTIYGGAGDDIINGNGPNENNPDANILYGEAGNDIIYGSGGNDTLSGGDGNDTITGHAGNDIFHYNTGIDVFKDSSGTDEIQLASGIVSGDISYYRQGAYDLVIVVDGEGSITISNFYAGSNKIETLRFYDTSTVDLTLISPTLFYGTQNGESFLGQSLSSNLVMYGYGGNDTMLGGTGNDMIYGGDGNDNLYGNSGNDYNEGGAGDDYHQDTNGGNDIYVYESGLDIVYDLHGTDTLRLNGSTTVNDLSFTDLGNHHKITINSGVDEIQLYYVDSSVNYTIEKMEFADGFATDTNWKTWTIGTGSGETLNGGSGNDTVVGKAGNDTLNGNNGNDAMHGGADNDNLYGNAGTDLLHGGTGDDALYGGDGLDTLYGGAGADTFYFDTNAFNNIDVVKDLTLGDGDALDIADILVGYDPMTDAITDFVTFTNSGSDTQVFVDRDGTGGTYSSQQIVLLVGVSSLNAETLETNNNLITV